MRRLNEAGVFGMSMAMVLFFLFMVMGTTKLFAAPSIDPGLGEAPAGAWSDITTEIIDFPQIMAITDIVTVTNNDVDDKCPSLNNGYAFWYRKDDGIIRWQTSQAVSTASKVVDTSLCGALSSYDDKVAFGFGTVRYWNGTSLDTVSTNTLGGVSLYGDTIAYPLADGSDFEIMLKKGSWEQQITNDGVWNIGPSLFNDKVAWVGDAIGPNPDIWYWDGHTARKISNNPGDDSQPCLYDGAIAWSGYDGNDYEIYYWNGTTITQITNDSESIDDRWPSLYDGKIAWERKTSDGWEIFYWDGTSIKQVTDNTKDDRYPSLYNGAILWTHYDGHDWEIQYSEVDVPQAPTVSALAASAVTQTTANINGSVNPNGQDTTYHFEWGTSTSYDHVTPDKSLSGSSSVDVYEGLTNLDPGTTYHFRLVAVNPSGTSNSADQTFTTVPVSVALPVLSTGDAANVTDTSARLTGTVNPSGADTTYRFEYGTNSTSYGSNTGWVNVGNGSTDVPVAMDISGLTPDTTYHYRLVAMNSAGTTDGDDRTFTTLSPAIVPPVVVSAGVESVGTDSVRFIGTVNPSGLSTEYRFEYGTNSTYGSSTEWQSAGNGSVNLPVTADVSGLASGTSYHYRLAARNSAGTTYSDDQTFSTEIPEYPMEDTARRFSGWWYDSAQPGTGVAMEIKGSNIFLAWFVYDEAGRTTWYASGGGLANDTVYSGELYMWTGWPWGETYSKPQASSVGTVTVIFNKDGNDTVTFTASVNGTSATHTLTSFMKDFAPGDKDSRNLTGWWWDPSYDGMGFFLDARGGQMAMVWYNYREDNSPRWWTSNGDFADGAVTYEDELDGWQGGQCPGCNYQQPSPINGEGGGITIHFTDGAHATMTVGSTTLNLQRFDF